MDVFDDGEEKTMPAGVYTLDELKGFGSTNGLCPYFLSRKMVFTFLLRIIPFFYFRLKKPT
jgi:hypothetical protein